MDGIASRGSRRRPIFRPTERACRSPARRLKGFNGQRSTMYAFGAFVYQSQNGGASWDNVTGYQGRSIIGDGVRDLAVSPRDPDEVTASTSAGVFRSLDGGKSWSGLNEGLPNLPARALVGLALGRPRRADRSSRQSRAGMAAGRKAGLAAGGESGPAPATRKCAAGSGRDGVRADGNDGLRRLAGRPHHCLRRRQRAPVHYSAPNGGKVERFWVDPSDPRIALAVLGARPDRRDSGDARTARAAHREWRRDLGRYDQRSSGRRGAWGRGLDRRAAPSTSPPTRAFSSRAPMSAC